jgi:hypothetical protein
MEETAARCQRRHYLAAGALTKPHYGSDSSLRDGFASCNIRFKIIAFPILSNCILNWKQYLKSLHFCQISQDFQIHFTWIREN